MSQSEALRLLNESTDVLVVCHRRPDADALGSALGFTALCRELGKDVTLYVPDELAHNLRFLDVSNVSRTLKEDARFDVTFVMDTAAVALLPDGLPGPEVRGPLVVIDHHAAHDDVGDVIVRDIEACATAEVVMDMAEELGLRPVPPAAATPLYAAFVADTGGFRYPSTRARVLRMGAELVDGGADPWQVAYELFEGWRPARMLLLGAVLKSLSVELEGRFAVMRVTRAMLDECGADDDMVEGMVNYGRMLRGVEIAALLWEFETPEGRVIKYSFRSQGNFDVSKVASALGGGGHRSAAGAQEAISIDDACIRMTALVSEVLNSPAKP